MQCNHNSEKSKWHEVSQVLGYIVEVKSKPRKCDHYQRLLTEIKLKYFSKKKKKKYTQTVFLILLKFCEHIKWEWGGT